MKKILLHLMALMLLAVPCLAGQYQVLKIVDGETIDIMYQGKKARIRMLCVNTPESVHPDQSRNTEMGRKASEYTKSRLWGKYVDGRQHNSRGLKANISFQQIPGAVTLFPLLKNYL